MFVRSARAAGSGLCANPTTKQEPYTQQTTFGIYDVFVFNYHNIIFDCHVNTLSKFTKSFGGWVKGALLGISCLSDTFIC